MGGASPVVRALRLALLATRIAAHGENLQEALPDDEECLADATVNGSNSDCALHALQVRGLMAMENDGIALPAISVEETHSDELGSGASHIFAIGDWGTLLPGHFTAPNVRPHGTKNKCPDKCDYVHGIDNKAQLLVAEQMKKRAQSSNPQYVLNVGDNFYWGGIEEPCGGGTNWASGKTISSFANVWQSVYGGLTGKPWISTLGNHDYGGYQFNMAWDQQIAYSKKNPNWVMPARYFKQTMHHPGFTVDVFAIDSNAFDAKEPKSDPMHNICSEKFNPKGATCASVGGPKSPEDCKKWFWDTYKQQKGWLMNGVKSSNADWQIVVTHFPCGHDAGYYHALHGAGLDFLVTGHRHDQELQHHASPPCIVTGGGGGITSEAPPRGEMTSQYGFFDLTISKSQMLIELINVHGNVIKSGTIRPH